MQGTQHPPHHLLIAGAAALALVHAACGDDAATTTSATGSGGAPGTSTAVTSGGDGGGTGGEGVTSALVSVGSQSGAGGGEGCADQEAEGNIVVRPVDVIFVIDNSGSMSGEIVEVEQEISSNFAAIIEAADPPIDYRVIMVSSHGESGAQQICIPQPLGGAPDLDGDGHCDEVPDVPMEGERFFHFDPDDAVSSTDALCHLIEDYSAPDRHMLHPTGYGELLRIDALKVFVVITDDRVSIGGGECPQADDQGEVEAGEAAAIAWDEAILGVDFLQFGTLDQRNYVFHSIVALAPFLQDNLAVPHPPETPIVTQVCTPDAQAPGTGYQAISKLTGGLRYPTCGLDYTPIFQRIAEGIIEGSAVACVLEVPEPPPGEELDPDSVRVVYDPGDGEDPVTFTRVDGSADCTADGFILDEGAGTITLCPQACSLVQSDDDAHLRVVFDCAQLPD
jgi:hypothetical protein